MRCTNRDFYCVNIPDSPSCGYTFQGQKRDYANDCVPCLDKNINFYYPLACSQAPDVCNINE